MDKFELKDKLIDIVETTDNFISDLLGPGCDDETVGYLRTKIASRLNELKNDIKREIYNLY